MKLHVGCGTGHLEGWINTDLYPGPHVDAAFDVQKDWPFPDDSASEIYSSHMLEHLADPLAFFREAWRVLQPSGSMLLRLPYGGHKAAWWDLTHLRPWFAESFCFLQPGYAKAVGNPQSSHWTQFFGVHAVSLRLSGKVWRLMRWKAGRWWLGKWGEHVPNLIEEIFAELYALKRPEDVAEYQVTHAADCVPIRFIVYRHQLDGRQLRTGEPAEMVPLAEGRVRGAFHSWTD